MATTALRLSVFCARSLDGYIAAQDGSLDWLSAAARPDEDYGHSAFLDTVDALAMGRGTYDSIAHLDLPGGGRPLYVFTHRPTAPRAGVTFWSASPREAVTHWAGAGLRRVYVDGGVLVSSFLAEDLIDDMLITEVPILLGAGRPLFHPIARTTQLTLESVTRFPSGLVNLGYRRNPQRGAADDPAVDG